MLETYGLHELVWDACDERFGDMLVASPADAGGRGISLAVRDGGAAADLTGATITITDKNGTTTADIAKGAPGEKGDTGATGPQGPQGEQGPKGETGATGATGPQGPRGETGPSGQDGADGVSCTHSWNGTVLSVTSASGTSSADLVGPQGPTGTTGPSGADGTVFTPASPLSLANGELSIDLSDYPTSEDLPKDFFGYYNFPRAKDSGGSTWVRLGYNNYWGNAKVGDLVFNNRFLTLASITRITKGYVDGAMPDLTGYATQTWVNSQITAAIAALDDLSEEEF